MNTYATIILLAVGIAAVLAQDDHAKATAAINACAAANNITPAQVAELKAAADKSTIPASADLKCFAKCVTDKSSVFASGVLDIKRVVMLSSMFGKDAAAVRANAAACAVRFPTAVTSCDEAWELYTCLF